MKTIKTFKSFTEKYTDHLRDVVLKLENSRNGHCSGSDSGGVGHCSGLKEEEDEEETTLD